MKHVKRLVIVVTLLLIVVLYLFAFKLKPSKKVVNENLIPYSKEGFVDAKGLSNTDKLVGENASFQLYLDETTSYFRVVDIQTGEVIRSNPNSNDPRDTPAVNDDVENLTFEVIKESYSHIFYQFSLPVLGKKGSVITWQSGDVTLIDNDFKVIPPAETKTTTLTATLNKDGYTASKVFTIDVTQTGAINPTSQEEHKAPFTPRGVITNEAKDKQKSTLEFSYYNQSGSVNTLNNYRLSIYHPETILEKEGNRTFQIKYLTDKIGFQVHYIIADQEIDYLYFPKYMTKELYNELSDDSFSVRFIKREMNFDREKDLYYIRDYEDMKFLTKYEFYNVYYNILSGYSRERAIEENASYGYLESRDVVKFEIGVEVSLTEKGFQTALIKESLVEPKNLKLASISLYPLLGTAISIHEDETPTTGYMVIPDGSGAVINFNNNKYDQRSYRKRIYGSDMSNIAIKQPEEQEVISLPLYGMIKEKIGMASIVKEGASMTFINADISERIDSYNKIYPTIQYRENYLHTLGTGYNTYSVSLWSKGMADTDLVVEHVILRLDMNSYMGVAKAYQDYLIKEKQLQKQPLSITPQATLEILGAYDVKEYIFGIPYNNIKSLTTFNETRKIVEELEGYDLNLLYNGALNGGLRNSLQTKVDFEGVLGGRNGYKKLDKYLEGKDINLYLQINITQTRSFRRAFDEYTYAAQRLEGSLSRDFIYHIPTMLPYSESPYMHSSEDYILSARYYNAVYNKLQKQLPTKKVSFTNIGSNLAGSYRNSDTVYKEDAMHYSTQILNKLKENILLRSPLGFALPYTRYAVDIPMDTTLYSIIDYAIPLTQLVLSEYIPYASKSLNMQVQRSEAHNFLKVLETGSQLKYTLTYTNPKELLNTEYTKYLSTYYNHWIPTIKEQMDTLESLNLYGGHLIAHERLASNVFKVTYSHGLVLYINYNTTPTVVEGITIDALSYHKGVL